MARSACFPLIACALLVLGCFSALGTPGRTEEAFAACFDSDNRCIAALMTSSDQNRRHRTLQTARRATIADKAAAYLMEPSLAKAQRHWAAFIKALDDYQTGNKGGRRAGAGASSAAGALVIVPAASDFSEDCASWAGDYRDAGSYAAADQSHYVGKLSFSLHCPNQARCGSERPYLATIEISEPSPDGATGAGAWYRYTAVPVKVEGRLLIAYADSDLYHELAKDAGRDQWCVNRSPPCYEKSASAGEVLFAVMMNCSKGIGILQWGSLADEAE